MIYLRQIPLIRTSDVWVLLDTFISLMSELLLSSTRRVKLIDLDTENQITVLSKKTEELLVVSIFLSHRMRHHVS